MTQLEIFKATMSHQPHERFLFYADFTPHLHEKLKSHSELQQIMSDTEFGMYTPVMVMPRAPEGAANPDYLPYFKDMKIPDNAFINHLGVLEIPGSVYHFTRYVSPLRNALSVDDVKTFPYNSFDGYTVEHMEQEVKNAHDRGLVACSWIGHMYEDSWQIRGYEEFLMDMIAAPEICEYILDTIANDLMHRAIAAAKAGVDVITTGDDVASQKAMMFNTDLWRKFIKSRWAKIYETVRSIKPDVQIWYHSDGNIEEIIPELIDIGVTILNPVQPECVDVIKLKKEYGKHLVFDGTIGTQSTMPFGSPDDVKQIVRERKQTLGYDGSLILSPTHILEPEVPLENILAFFQAARE